MIYGSHYKKRTRWININSVKIIWDNQPATLNFFSDITGQKNAEARYEQSDAQYRHLFNFVQEGLGYVDADEKVVYCNPAFARIYDYDDPEKMVGKSVEDYLEDDQRQIIREQTEKRKRGEYSQYELQIRTHKNNDKTILISISSRFDASGNYLGAFGSIIDITDRKNMERELIFSEERFRQLSEATFETILIHDNKNIITANESASKMFGYSMSELENMNLNNLFASADHDKIQYDIKSDGLLQNEITCLRKDGTIFQGILLPKKIEYRERTAYVAAVRDITDLKLMEEERQNLQKNLGRAEKMESLGLLASGVAHDLNNILMPLVAYPDIIIPKLPPGSSTIKQIQRMGSSAQEAAGIVADLLTMARRGRYLMEPTNINDIITQYLDTPNYLGLIKEQPNITINLNLDEQIEEIKGSCTHLGKVIMNLIINAFDAIDGDGEITISSYQKKVSRLLGDHDKIQAGDYVILSVKDSGSGIPEETIGKIFDPYYSSKKIGRSGSGLGLSVVYGIIKDHGAYYDILTKINAGTEFVFYFPATGVAASSKRAVDREIYGNEKILLIEDSIEHRDMTVQLLEGLGYKIDAVDSGQTALEYLDINAVDIVIMDMYLEDDFDALDTYRLIVEKYPEQKAIIISGYSPNERVAKLQKMGISHFVQKPFSRKILARALRESLDGIKVDIFE